MNSPNRIDICLLLIIAICSMILWGTALHYTLYSFSKNNVKEYLEYDIKIQQIIGLVIILCGALYYRNHDYGIPSIILVCILLNLIEHF